MCVPLYMLWVMDEVLFSIYMWWLQSFCSLPLTQFSYMQNSFNLFGKRALSSLYASMWRRHVTKPRNVLWKSLWRATFFCCVTQIDHHCWKNIFMLAKLCLSKWFRCVIKNMLAMYSYRHEKGMQRVMVCYNTISGATHSKANNIIVLSQRLRLFLPTRHLRILLKWWR